VGSAVALVSLMLQLLAVQRQVAAVQVLRGARTALACSRQYRRSQQVEAVVWPGLAQAWM